MIARVVLHCLHIPSIALLHLQLWGFRMRFVRSHILTIVEIKLKWNFSRKCVLIHIVHSRTQVRNWKNGPVTATVKFIGWILHEIAMYRPANLPYGWTTWGRDECFVVVDYLTRGIRFESRDMGYHKVFRECRQSLQGNVGKCLQHAIIALFFLHSNS
jgi:hypothetical protein